MLYKIVPEIFDPKQAFSVFKELNREENLKVISS
jgi:hypothetical protein